MSTPVATTSIEAYRLFSDSQWAELLRSRGVDLRRRVRYEVGDFRVAIYYHDQPSRKVRLALVQ